MKYEILYGKTYHKQYKLLEKRGFNMNLLDDVVKMLADGQTLPAKYQDHPLKGEKNGYRDCHIKNDWILIYKIDNSVLTLYFIRNRHSFRHFLITIRVLFYASLMPIKKSRLLVLISEIFLS